MADEALERSRSVWADKSRQEPKETCRRDFLLPPQIPEEPTSYRLGPALALSFMVQAMCLLLFQKNIVHRDLKLGNMVLNKR